MADSRAWSPRWAAGALFGLASFLCMASGALTLAAVIGLHLMQTACGRRAGVQEWLGIAALAAATAVLASLIPHVPSIRTSTAHIRLDSSCRRLRAGELAGPSQPRLAHGPAVGAVLLAHIRRSAGAERSTLVQCRRVRMGPDSIRGVRGGAGADPGREPLPGHAADRPCGQYDSFFWLATSDPASGKRRVWWSAALAAWLVIVAASLVHPAHPLPGSMDLRRQTADVEERNLRFYLATGDASYLAGAPLIDIPYPEATRLRQLLDTPRFARPCRQSFSRGMRRRIGSKRSRGLSSAQGYTWLGAGVLLLIAVIAREALAPAGSTAPRTRKRRAIADFRKAGRSSP